MGVGCGDQDLKLRALGLGCGASDLKLRGYGLGFSALSLGFGIEDLEFKV